MRKSERKAKLRQWRQQARAAARGALPIPPAELKELFDMLSIELPQHGCDHTRRLADSWLQSRGHDLEATGKWFDKNGGFCDCEVLANCEQAFDEAMRGT